ncbi:hypothetical protein JY448_03400 [Stenotrophomonas maltophilia]|nr:hypothetical protein [Stenotrophomonas maltophilia]
MKVAEAVRLVLGVAVAFGGYIHEAHAESCYAQTTMTVENCPPGSRPNPQWPGGDANGNPQDGPPKLIYVTMPYIPNNPFAMASCSAATPSQREDYASYAIQYFIAYESNLFQAQGQPFKGFDPRTEFHVVFPDGTFLTYYDWYAQAQNIPVTGVNLRGGDGATCPALWAPISSWPKLGDANYLHYDWS